ncbi:EamA family transporter [bacterium]|nr:EamA family transporter [bacterium]
MWGPSAAGPSTRRTCWSAVASTSSTTPSRSISSPAPFASCASKDTHEPVGSAPRGQGARRGGRRVTGLPHFGETMGLLAAFIFAWTSIFFTTAGRRVGVTTLNLLRLLGAVILLGSTQWLLFGDLWPEAPLASILWIGASGIVGLAIGDSALFRAFTIIGPRRGMLAMATAPVFTVLVAWALIDEALGLQAMVGIAVVMGGVMMAILGKDPGGGDFADPDRAMLRKGYLLAMVAAAGQGLGSAFVKIGMAGGAVEVAPLAATFVRMVFAWAAYWLFVLPRHDLRALLRPLRDRRGAGALALATFLGPYVSVYISILAIRYAEAGVAQVLLGTVPIFVLLPSWLVYRDRPTVMAGVGVVVAVFGGALLFLR